MLCITDSEDAAVGASLLCISDSDDAAVGASPMDMLRDAFSPRPPFLRQSGAERSVKCSDAMQHRRRPLATRKNTYAAPPSAVGVIQNKSKLQHPMKF